MAVKSNPSKKGTKKVAKKARLFNPISHPTVLRDTDNNVTGFKYASGKTVVAKATKAIKDTSKKARKQAKKSRCINRRK